MDYISPDIDYVQDSPYRINCDDNNWIFDPPEGTRYIIFENINQKAYDSIWPLFTSSLRMVEFYDGNLDYLFLPEGIEYVNAPDLGLKRIHVPDSIYILYCDKNRLVEIDLPRNISKLYATSNKLKRLTVRTENLERLEDIYLKNNPRLLKLDFKPPPMFCWLEVDEGVDVSQEIKDALLQSGQADAAPLFQRGDSL